MGRPKVEFDGNGEEPLEIQEIFRALKKGRINLLLVTLLALCSAGVWNFFIVKLVYQASALVMVKPETDYLLYPMPQYSDQLVAENQLAEIYLEIAYQPASAEKVIQAAGLDIRPSELDEIIQVKRLDATSFLKVIAEGKDPQAASGLADKAALVFGGELSRLMPGNSAILVHPAAQPLQAEGSGRGKNMAAAGGVGFILAVSRILFMASLDGTVKTGLDITQCLKMPLLAEVPQFLSSLSMPHSLPAGEDFSILAAQASLAGLGSRIKTLLVTSAGPGEGKSLVAARLSHTLFLRGENVILADCNLKEPTQHLIWNLENSQGLSDLAGRKIPAAILLRQTSIPSVQLVTGGSSSPPPAELFASANFKHLMEELRILPAIKIFDAPSMASSADALTLAGQIDGILFVVSARTYSMGFIGETVRRLNAAGVLLLGVVLNRAEKG